MGRILFRFCNFFVGVFHKAYNSMLHQLNIHLIYSIQVNLQIILEQWIIQYVYQFYLKLFQVLKYYFLLLGQMQLIVWISHYSIIHFQYWS
jgi:hypothetical protein